MLVKKINAPFTSSVGRLFDAVASILGLRQKVGFEGQAAMELEFAAEQINLNETYSFLILPTSSAEHQLVIDWANIFQQILEELINKIPKEVIAAKFHNTLIDICVSVARCVNEAQVVLTGGCFQNKYLVERTVTALRKDGFDPYWHRKVPSNDGGIALGQIMAASREISKESTECV
jgi:hydrogenase maturation protein HypF